MLKTLRPKILVLGDIEVVERYSTTRSGNTATFCEVDLAVETEKSLGLAGEVAASLVKMGAHVALSSVVGEDQARLDAEELLNVAGVDQHLYSYYDYPTIKRNVYNGVPVVQVVTAAHIEDAKLRDDLSFFNWPMDAVITVNAGYGVICPRLLRRVDQYLSEHPRAKRYSLSSRYEIMISTPFLEKVMNELRDVSRDGEESTKSGKLTGGDGSASLPVV